MDLYLRVGVDTVQYWAPLYALVAVIIKGKFAFLFNFQAITCHINSHKDKIYTDIATMQPDVNISESQHYHT